VKKIIFFVSAVLVIAGAAVFLIPRNDEPIDDFSVVAWVNGEPVSIGEYRYELAKNYTAVLTKAVSAGGRQGKRFWDEKIPGAGNITPLEMLKTAAVESSARRKITMLWACEYGLAGDISWRGFLEKFNGENLRRRNALSAGDPVYGPEQFTQKIYYDLVLGETGYELKKALEAKFEFDEGELMRLYESDYRRSAYHPGTISLEYASIRLDAEGSSQTALSLWQAVSGGEEVEVATQRFGAKFYSRGINLMRLPGMGIPPQFQEAMLALSPGEISPVVEYDERYWIFKCVEREGEKYLSFEETRPVITYRLIEADYNKQLDDRMKDAIKINSKVYAKINRKFIIENSVGSR
jgi:hypothetical protein